VRPATPRPGAPEGAVGRTTSRWPIFLWLAALLVGSALVAVGLLAFLPLRPDANESVAINVPAQPPGQKPPLAPSTAAAADKKVASAASGEAVGPDEALGQPEPPEPPGVRQEPKVSIVADTPTGLYAARTMKKTAAWLAERGGTVESQKAVEDGLNWLARHQGEAGHWGADCLGKEPNSRCEEKAPCQGAGRAYEIAQTGLALLAFQAAGHYDFNGQKYSGQVAQGLDYLVSEQAPDGSIVGSQNPTPEQMKAGALFERNFMYEHAMATFALCEACAVAVAEGRKSDPRYQAAAERAVSFIEKIQHDDGGWRYMVDASEASDCSVSGWVMLALKTAREANISVSPKTISRMMDFFAAHYMDDRKDDRKEVANPPIIVDYDGQPVRSYHGTNYVDYTHVGGPIQVTSDAMTGVGMMAVEFFEHKLDAPIVQWGAGYLADKAGALTLMGRSTPAKKSATYFIDKSGPKDVVTSVDATGKVVTPMDVVAPIGGYYIWYNCTMAMFQAGGEPWKRWNGVIRDRVVSLQVPGEGCDRGSWPPDDEFGDAGGRIYSTALAVLTLEVYYRFQRIAGQPEKEEFFAK